MTATGMRALLEARTAKKGELQALHDKHQGAFPTEVQTAWDGLSGELQAIEQRISRQSVLDDTELRIAGQSIGGGHDNRWKDLIGGYSLCKALLYSDSAVDAGREREASQEVEKRTGRASRGLTIPDEVFRRPIERRAGPQVAQTGTLGGFLVGEVQRGDLFIDMLRAASILPSLNVTYLDGLIGAQSIPRQVDASTVVFVGETEEPAESALSFGAVTLTPRTSAGQVAFSRRLLMNSTPSIEMLVRSDLAKQQSAAQDIAALSGISAKEPRGLLHQGITTLPIATNGGALTYSLLVDLSASPDLANAAGADMRWLTNPKVVASARKIVDGQQRPMFPELPGSLMGWPLVSSTAVPSNLSKGSASGTLSAVIAGDFSTVLVGRWEGTQIVSNPYSRMGSGQTIVHTFADIDIALRHPEALACFIDVLP